MEMYNAIVEVATQNLDVDAAMEELAAYHPSLSQSPRGWATAHINLPGESLPQATTSACAIVATALGAPAIACEVMTEAEFNAREGWETVPELISVAAAAHLLRVSRQRVLQRIQANTLPAIKVGRDYVLTRSAVEALAAREEEKRAGA